MIVEAPGIENDERRSADDFAARRQSGSTWCIYTQHEMNKRCNPSRCSAIQWGAGNRIVGHVHAKRCESSPKRRLIATQRDLTGRKVLASANASGGSTADVDAAICAAAKVAIDAGDLVILTAPKRCSTCWAPSGQRYRRDAPDAREDQPDRTGTASVIPSAAERRVAIRMVRAFIRTASFGAELREGLAQTPAVPESTRRATS
jgi:hypothetical protein